MRPFAATQRIRRILEISRSGSASSTEKSARFAGRKRPALGRQAHGLGRHQGRRLQGLHGREAGLNVELQRSQQAVAGHRAIGAGHDWHPGIKQRLDHALAVADAAPRGGRVGVVDHAAIVHRERWGRPREPGLERLDRRTGRAAEQFVPGQRGIDHGLAPREQVDQRARASASTGRRRSACARRDPCRPQPPARCQAPSARDRSPSCPVHAPAR